MTDKQKENEFTPAVSFNELCEAHNTKTTEEFAEALHLYKDGLVKQIKAEMNGENFITIPRVEFAFLMKSAGSQVIAKVNQSKTAILIPEEALELTVQNALSLYIPKSFEFYMQDPIELTKLERQNEIAVQRKIIDQKRKDATNQNKKD